MTRSIFSQLEGPGYVHRVSDLSFSLNKIYQNVYFFKMAFVIKRALREKGDSRNHLYEIIDI
jgi:hypothetical protein